MPVATFDTLKFARALRDAGVSDLQAEAEAAVLSEIFSINFRDVATKDDLNHAVQIVEGKIRETEQRLDAKIDGVRSDLREAEQRMNARIDGMGYEFKHIKWMVGASITIMTGVAIRLFFFR